LNERTRLLKDVDEAVAGGAAHYKAAELMGLSQRTLKSWRHANGEVTMDQRSRPGRHCPVFRLPPAAGHGAECLFPSILVYHAVRYGGCLCNLGSHELVADSQEHQGANGDYRSYRQSW